jgi:hypothetical protein
MGARGLIMPPWVVRGRGGRWLMACCGERPKYPPQEFDDMTRIGFILLCTVATAATAQTPAALGTEKAQNSYALGQEVASSIKQSDADLDVNALLQGQLRGPGAARRHGSQ